MKKLLFADLDDTLFQSARKNPPASDWPPAAYLKDGSVVSYISPKQQALLAGLMREFTVIPVTARDYSALQRVTLSFSSYSIINYGGVILDKNKSVDNIWLQQSNENAQTRQADLNLWLEHLNNYNNPDWKIRIVSDFDIPFYIVIKSKTANLDSVQKAYLVCQMMEKEGIITDSFLHINDNNIAIIPNWLNKKFAVNYILNIFRQESPDILSIGMGDSLVDLGFMGLCDYQIVPNTSQVAKQRLLGL